MTNEVINVEGMSCDHCKHSIEKALNGLDGVT
ncbi:cation transporter, partial [Staphylococcus haemolyticus]